MVGPSRRRSVILKPETLPAMIAFLLATLAAILTAVGAWSADQRLLRCGTVFRGVVATLLMVASVWVATLIQAAIWLKTPGAYGPVQYWHSDETAMAFMNGPSHREVADAFSGAHALSAIYSSSRPGRQILTLVAFRKILPESLLTPGSANSQVHRWRPWCGPGPIE
jgi:hypothetical protein